MAHVHVSSVVGNGVQDLRMQCYPMVTLQKTHFLSFIFLIYDLKYVFVVSRNQVQCTVNMIV